MNIVFTKNFLLLALFFIGGFLNISESIQTSKTVFLKERFKKTFVSGRVRKVEVLDGVYRILIDRVWIPEVDKKELPSSLRVKTRNQDFYPEIGKYIKFTGAVSPPPTASTLRGFNFARYAYFKNIGGVGSVFYGLKYHEKFMKSRHRKPDYFWEKMSFWVENLRRDVNLKIDQKLERGDTKQITHSLVSGERYSAGFDLSDKFLTAGITHILSISGFHMGIIAFMSFFLIRLVVIRIKYLSLRYDAKNISLFISIIPITFYMLISGARLPTVRAYIMCLIFILVMMFGRSPFSKRSVFISAFLIVLFAPASVINPGFLMSFSSVLALISIYENFPYYARISAKYFHIKNGNNRFKESKFFKSVKKIGYFFYLNFLTNITAWMFTLPFAIYFFKKTSLISVLSNIIIVPIFSFIVMPLILLFYLVYFIDPLKNLILMALKCSIDLMVWIIDWIVGFYQSPILTPALPQEFIWFISAGLLWFFVWKSKWKKWGLLLVLVGLSTIFNMKKPDLIISKSSNIMTFVMDNNEGLAFKNIRKGRMSTYSLISISEEFAFDKSNLKKFKNNGKKLLCEKDFCKFDKKGSKILYLTDYFKYPENFSKLGDLCKFDIILNVDENGYFGRKIVDRFEDCSNKDKKLITKNNVKEASIVEVFISDKIDAGNSKIEIKTFKNMFGHFIWNKI
ncbi:MAG: ComEC family competence protein [Alphaproteobacteria bacterium]|nr:ComEC family competence protein [Alphaproteobacteria bacterium]